jgi:hypothetical protein
MYPKSPFSPLSVTENWFERKYTWLMNDGEISVVTRQYTGSSESEAEFCLKGSYFFGNCILRWGEDASMRNVQKLHTVDEFGLQIKGLKQRGTRYFFSVWQIDKGVERCTVPVKSFRTPVRYPYGRSYMDNYKNLTQHFGQDVMVGYDLEYYSNDDSIDPVRRFLGDTSIEGYLEHIIHSVVRPEMTKMDKAIAIGNFLGPAIHHNPIHINLRETVAALEEFGRKGWKEACIDNESVWLMELGHTRCGVINGFLSASLLRRVDIPNEVFYGCGGHTTGRILVDGIWYLWDVDAFKGQLPLDGEGRLPAIEWLKKDKNIYLLDAYPSWEDSNPDGGWIRTFDGKRMSGYIGGGRYHSESGFGSSFLGGTKEYPPSVPLLLDVLFKVGDEVLLEWIGSYDRDGDFKDYLVELYEEESGNKVMECTTEKTYVVIKLPDRQGRYYWTVRARDRHAEGTLYADRIFYTSSVRMPVPTGDRQAYNSIWDLITSEDSAERINLITDCEDTDFIRVEGFDDSLGQTNYCTTELWKIRAGRKEKPLYRLVDETNCLFNGCHVRSLWVKKLEKTKRNIEGWHLTLVLYISKYSMAGKSRYPLIWIGRERYHLGFGLIMYPDKGLVFTGSNVFGDWRCGSGFEPCGWFRFDIENIAGEKIVNYFLNGELIYKLDTSIFKEESFDVDMLYISSNPEAELDFFIGDILI